MKNKFKVSGISQFIDMDGLKGDEIVERKQMSMDLVPMDISEDDEKTVIARISSILVDADGDIIIPEGCDFKRYSKNPVILVDHDYKVENVVGNAIDLAVRNNGLYAKIKFADTDKANDVWKLVKGGFLKANSIGFIIKSCLLKGTKEFKEYVNTHKSLINENLQRIITEYELIESSIVAVPSNENALMTAISLKSIELSDKTIKELKLDSPISIEGTQVISNELLTAILSENKDIGELKEYVKELKEFIFKGKDSKDKVISGDVVKDTDKVNEDIVGVLKEQTEGIEEDAPITDNKESIKDDTATQEQTLGPLTEDPIIEPVEEITIIRLGDYDIEKELKAYNSLRLGKIL